MRKATGWKQDYFSIDRYVERVLGTYERAIAAPGAERRELEPEGVA